MDVINLTDADFDKYGKFRALTRDPEIPTALSRSKLIYYTYHYDEQLMAVRMCSWSSMHHGADTARYVCCSVCNDAASWSLDVFLVENCDIIISNAS